MEGRYYELKIGERNISRYDPFGFFGGLDHQYFMAIYERGKSIPCDTLVVDPSLENEEKFYTSFKDATTKILKNLSESRVAQKRDMEVTVINGWKDKVTYSVPTPSGRRDITEYREFQSVGSEIKEIIIQEINEKTR